MGRDHSTAVAAIFGTGGAVTLLLYALIVLAPPSSALDRDTTWGYLGRYGRTVKWIWGAVTVVTAAAVLGMVAWIVYVSSDHPGDTALAAVSVFMTGAVLWPVGVLSGSLRLAQAGVLWAAVGSVLLLLTVLTETAPPPLVVVAAGWVVFHHCVIDGLWAVLTPAGVAHLVETLLQ